MAGVGIQVDLAAPIHFPVINSVQDGLDLATRPPRNFKHRGQVVGQAVGQAVGQLTEGFLRL
jgi:hypothetical protein